MRIARGSVRVSDRAERNHPLHGRQRLQHGGRLAALRRQRQRASGGAEGIRHKAEVKNVNSFRFIRAGAGVRDRAADRACIESGGKIEQETRLYNAHEGRTYGMRSKEQAHDYRYFPEPDLLPLVVDERGGSEIASQLPELPEARRERMMREYGITPCDAASADADASAGRSVRGGGAAGEESEARGEPGAERITGTAESEGP